MIRIMSGEPEQANRTGVASGRLSILLYPLSLILLLAACGREEEPAAGEAEPVRFVATIPVLGSILEEVVGDRGEVVVLLQPGASPHTFEPRPSDVRAASQARVLFYVAPTLDGWVARLSAPHRVPMLQLLPPEYRMEWEDAHHHHDHDHDHHHHDDDWDLYDPHFWTDPLAVRALLPRLAEVLGAMDPQGAAHYADNASRFHSRLETLHREIAQELEPVRGQPVLLFHPSFRYMLHRYGLEEAGVIEPAPGREATPRYLQELTQRIRERGIRAVFTEPQLSPRPAEVLAEAAGIGVYVLDPVGGFEGRSSYEELMRFNAGVLREALSE